MHANLIAQIHRIFSSFIMKLVHVLPVLEKRARKAGLPNPNRAPNEGPLYVLGCSSSAAGDIIKADDQSNFPNIYPGMLRPAGSFGIFTDNLGDTYQIHPLAASQLMMEHLWDHYQSTAPDPVPGWTQDPGGDADDDTQFYTNSSPVPANLYNGNRNKMTDRTGDLFHYFE